MNKKISLFLLIFIFLFNISLFSISKYPTPIGKWKYLEPDGKTKWIYEFNNYLSGDFILYRGSISQPDNKLPVVIKGKFKMSSLNIHCTIESSANSIYSNNEYKMRMNLNDNPIYILDEKNRKFIYFK